MSKTWGINIFAHSKTRLKCNIFLSTSHFSIWHSFLFRLVWLAPVFLFHLRDKNKVCRSFLCHLVVHCVKSSIVTTAKNFTTQQIDTSERKSEQTIYLMCYFIWNTPIPSKIGRTKQHAKLTVCMCCATQPSSLFDATASVWAKQNSKKTEFDWDFLSRVSFIEPRSSFYRVKWMKISVDAMNKIVFIRLFRCVRLMSSICLKEHRHDNHINIPPLLPLPFKNRSSIMMMMMLLALMSIIIGVWFLSSPCSAHNRFQRLGCYLIALCVCTQIDIIIKRIHFHFLVNPSYCSFHTHNLIQPSFSVAKISSRLHLLSGMLFAFDLLMHLNSFSIFTFLLLILFSAIRVTATNHSRFFTWIYLLFLKLFIFQLLSNHSWFLISDARNQLLPHRDSFRFIFKFFII